MVSVKGERSNYPIFSFGFELPCRFGLVVSVSASHTVGRGFASRPGHTKDLHKNGTNCLPAWHAMSSGRSLTVQPEVVCGTVYVDTHLKYLLGSIARVGYCIPISDFYLVLHGLRWRKRTIMGWSIEFDQIEEYTPSFHEGVIVLTLSINRLTKVNRLHLSGRFIET